MKPAKFVVVEGIDGSGTSTQARAVAQALTAKGESAVVTFEPSDRDIGRLLRRLLSGEMKSSGKPKTDRRLFAYLFAADRHDHVENREDGIKHHLAEGRHVVCARYVLSSYAYEGESAEELHFVEQLNQPFPIPDLTIYLDCPVEVSLDRIQKTRSRVDVFENKEKLTRVRQNYERMVQHYKGRRLLIDATRPADEITAEILALMKTL